MSMSPFEEKLVASLEKSLNKENQFSRNLQDQAHFFETTFAATEKRWVKRPWMMLLALRFHKLLLKREEASLQRLGTQADDNQQKERIESLRFAAEFSQRANAVERRWFYRQCRLYQITKTDATFLVWHRTLCLKKQTIYFGHWDWICGIFYMLPLLYPILYCLFVCLGTGSPVGKTMVILIDALMINTLFSIYKSASFDVYQVGSRYFKPNGLSYIPRAPKGTFFF